MFRLFQRIPKGLDPVAEIFKVSSSQPAYMVPTVFTLMSPRGSTPLPRSSK